MNSLFQMFDTRQKNYLDKEDFKRVQNGSFTSIFIERLFETHVANGGLKMSYEEFVIFQIAYNHLAHPSALAYFFKILDVNSDGFLDNYELHYFYTELRLAYNGWFMDGAMPEFGDFTDQFYDMVKPAVNRRITLQELLACKQGHDFILCLISHTEFYRYEMKESENGAQDSEMPSYCGEDNLDEVESGEENSEKINL
uniref:EF-hand domain-containing protein n=1 Tax=Meloidogyne hapla TaxID=6305 RepID=A0A1I8AYH4_MELHA